MKFFSKSLFAAVLVLASAASTANPLANSQHNDGLGAIEGEEYLLNSDTAPATDSSSVSGDLFVANESELLDTDSAFIGEQDQSNGLLILNQNIDHESLLVNRAE